MMLKKEQSDNKKIKTRLIVPLLACSFIELISVSMIAFSLTSCSKKNFTDSYYTLTNNPSQPIYFSEANTPISSFCASISGYSNSSITINYSSVNVNNIFSLCFGDSYNGITSVGNNWLLGETVIGASSIKYFSSLSSIDFSGLSSLSSVGDNWMYGEHTSFSCLTSINFKGLDNLSVVGNNWIYGRGSCFSSMTSIDFSGLSSLSSVGSGWMNGSYGGFSNLSSIDFSGLSNLSSVQDNWLYGIYGGFSSLTSINFNGLSSLSSVRTNWMCGTNNGFPKLSSINFSGLSSLSDVSSNWMDGSDGGFSSMTSIKVGNINWKNGFIEDYFCCSWPAADPTNHTIYGNTSSIANSWQKGGITSWRTWVNS